MKGRRPGLSVFSNYTRRAPSAHPSFSPRALWAALKSKPVQAKRSLPAEGEGAGDTLAGNETAPQDPAPSLGPSPLAVTVCASHVPGVEPALRAASWTLLDSSSPGFEFGSDADLRKSLSRLLVPQPLVPGQGEGAARHLGALWTEGGLSGPRGHTPCVPSPQSQPR